MDAPLAKVLGRHARRNVERSKHRFKAFAVSCDGTYRELEADGIFLETAENRGVFMPLHGPGGPHEVELFACPPPAPESRGCAHFVTKHACSNAFSVSTELDSD
jgi:hypothetical protein